MATLASRARVRPRPVRVVVAVLAGGLAIWLLLDIGLNLGGTFKSLLGDRLPAGDPLAGTISQVQSDGSGACLRTDAGEQVCAALQLPGGETVREGQSVVVYRVVVDGGEVWVDLDLR